MLPDYWLAKLEADGKLERSLTEIPIGALTMIAPSDASVRDAVDFLTGLQCVHDCQPRSSFVDYFKAGIRKFATASRLDTPPAAA